MKKKWVVYAGLGVFLLVVVGGLIRLGQGLPRFEVENKSGVKQFQLSSLWGNVFLWKMGYLNQIDRVKVIYTDEPRLTYRMNAFDGQEILSTSLDKQDGNINISIRYNKETNYLIDETANWYERDIYAAICMIFEKNTPTESSDCYKKADDYVKWSTSKKIPGVIKGKNILSFTLVKQAYAQSCYGSIPCGQTQSGPHCVGGDNPGAPCPAGTGCEGGTCVDSTYCDLTLNRMDCDGVNQSVCNNAGINQCYLSCNPSGDTFCSWLNSPPPPSGGCVDINPDPNAARCSGTCSTGTCGKNDDNVSCGCRPASQRKTWISFHLDNGNGVWDAGDAPAMLQGPNNSCGSYTIADSFVVVDTYNALSATHHNICDNGPKIRFDRPSGGMYYYRVVSQPSNYRVIGVDPESCYTGSSWDAGSLTYNCFTEGTGEDVRFLVQPYTPPPTPPTCTLTGPTNLEVGGAAGTYTKDSSNSGTAEVFRTTTDSNNSGWVPIGNQNPDQTFTWTCPAAGTYYLTCNAYAPISGGNPRCTGNPWCSEWSPTLPGESACAPAWSDCGPNDLLTVTCNPPPPAYSCLSATISGPSTIPMNTSTAYSVAVNQQNGSYTSTTASIVAGTGAATVSGSGLNFSVIGTAAGTLTLRVNVYKDGVWACSDDHQITISCPLPAVPTPTNPVPACGATSAMLSWSPIVGHTFNMQTSVDGTNWTNRLSNSWNTSWNYTGLVSGITYYWRVQSINSCGALSSWVNRNFEINACTATVTPQVIDSATCNPGATIVPTGWGGGRMWLVRAASSYSQHDPLPPNIDTTFGFSSVPAPQSGSWSYSLNFQDFIRDGWVMSNCNDQTETVLVSNGSTAIPRFYLTQSASPWFRVTKGDVGARNTVGSVTVPSGMTFLGPSDTSSGVAIGGVDVNINGAGALGPTGREWETTGISNFPTSPTSWYEYFVANFDQVVDPESGGTFTMAQLLARPEWVDLEEESDSQALYVGEDLTINGAGNVGSGKWTVFVEGDLLINLPAPGNITVTNGAFLGFVVSGNITFGANTRMIQGVYIADQTLTVDPSTGTVDTSHAFNGEGIFVGMSDVSLSRDLDPGGTLNNNSTPAVKFTYRPDFLINAPVGFLRSGVEWQEVPPEGQ